MCQIEEFAKYIYTQVKGDENAELIEQPIQEEENLDEEQPSSEQLLPAAITPKDNITESDSKHKRYKTYSIEFKMQLIETAKSTNDVKEVAEIYGINPKTLHRWMEKVPKKNQGGGRKIKEPEMVKQLLDWYNITSKEKGRVITTREFRDKALKFSKDPTFRASKGWLQKFRRRHPIVLNIKNK